MRLWSGVVVARVDVAVTVLRTMKNVVNVDNTNSTKVARKLARSNGQVTAGRRGQLHHVAENFLRALIFFFELQ